MTCVSQLLLLALCPGVISWDAETPFRQDKPPSPEVKIVTRAEVWWFAPPPKQIWFGQDSFFVKAKVSKGSPSIIAYRLSDGERLWVHTLPPEKYAGATGIIVGHDRVAYRSRTELVLLDGATGKVLTERAFEKPDDRGGGQDFSDRARMVLTPKYLLAGIGSKAVAFDLKGKEKWTFELIQKKSRGFQSIEHERGLTPVEKITVHGDTLVLFHKHGTRLRGISTKGKRLWVWGPERDADTSVLTLTVPFPDPEMVLASNRKDHLMLFSPRSGKVEADFIVADYPNFNQGRPLRVGGRIIFKCGKQEYIAWFHGDFTGDRPRSRHVVRIFPLNLNRNVPQAYGNTMFAGVAGDLLIFDNKDKTVRAIDPKRGSKRWEYKKPNVAEGVVAFGNIVAVNEGRKLVVLDAKTGDPKGELEGLISTDVWTLDGVPGLLVSNRRPELKVYDFERMKVTSLAVASSGRLQWRDPSGHFILNARRRARSGEAKLIIQEIVVTGP